MRSIHELLNHRSIRVDQALASVGRSAPSLRQSLAAPGLTDDLIVREWTRAQPPGPQPPAEAQGAELGVLNECARRMLGRIPPAGMRAKAWPKRQANWISKLPNRNSAKKPGQYDFQLQNEVLSLFPAKCYNLYKNAGKWVFTRETHFQFKFVQNS